ncbi:glycosyl hydrolase [Xylariomycetidae sp. FL0641]|nr:glycosyl hydrolase [Xylariomycetidae sp. FL0641]
MSRIPSRQIYPWPSPSGRDKPASMMPNPRFPALFKLSQTGNPLAGLQRILRSGAKIVNGLGSVVNQLSRSHARYTMVAEAQRPLPPKRWKRQFIRIYLPILTAVLLIIFVVALTVSLTTKSSHATPTPETTKPIEPRGYPNPVTLKGTIPNNDHPQTLDPSVIRRADGKLFLYTTHKNGSVWTADSLYGPWKHEGIAQLPENGGAPSINKIDDTYYMVYNNHEFEYMAHGVSNIESSTWAHGSSLLVASSKTLMPGSWTQHGRLDIDWAERYNLLDGNFLIVNDGDKRQIYLAFGSYQKGLFMLPMADPPTKVAAGANNQITHLANNVTSAFPDGGPTEASYMFTWKGWHYLFFSSGRCCRQPKTKQWMGVDNVYKVMVCRSKDPRQGYVDDKGRSCADQNGGKMILATHDDIWAPGGQGVMYDDEVKSPLMYYHYVPYDQEKKQPENRFLFGWNKLDFSSGWPEVVGS